MALTRPEVEAMVRRFADRLRAEVQVDEVWVFGSYAAGTPTEHSDIDVAVVSPAFGRDRWAEVKLLSRARLPDAFLVEPLAFPSEQRHHPPRGSLLREIIRTGYRVV